jgi:hypothetical protein
MSAQLRKFARSQLQGNVLVVGPFGNASPLALEWVMVKRATFGMTPLKTVAICPTIVKQLSSQTDGKSVITPWDAAFPVFSQEAQDYLEKHEPCLVYFAHAKSSTEIPWSLNSSTHFFSASCSTLDSISISELEVVAFVKDVPSSETLDDLSMLTTYCGAYFLERPALSDMFNLTLRKVVPPLNSPVALVFQVIKSEEKEEEKEKELNLENLVLGEDAKAWTVKRLELYFDYTTSLEFKVVKK